MRAPTRALSVIEGRAISGFADIAIAASFPLRLGDSKSLVRQDAPNASQRGILGSLTGFGEPMTLLLGEPSPGFLVAVMTPRAKGSSTKSAKATCVTDDWEGYHRLIPDDQLFAGKDLTASIEQDNSNIRHFLAVPPPHTKVVSKVVEMVDLSLKKPQFSGLSIS
jgi:hypothetical protein